MAVVDEWKADLRKAEALGENLEFIDTVSLLNKR
jgi:hypothetical protein